MFTALLLLAQPVPATTAPITPPTPAEVFASLDGNWEGVIEYRDYQSDTLQSIPMRANMESRPDGVTMVQRFSFSDPRAAVYATNLIAFGGDTLSGAAARAGRPFETYQQKVTVTSSEAKDRWSLIMAQEGMDDNRPASIRETVIRIEGQMIITKEVDFLDDNKQQWDFRNRVTLNKID